DDRLERPEAAQSPGERARVAVELVPGDRKDLCRVLGLSGLDRLHRNLAHRRSPPRVLLEHDPFPDHAANGLQGATPAKTRPRLESSLGQILIGKPESTFPGHALHAGYQTETTAGNQGISNTVVSSAMPRSAARCIIGCNPELSRILMAFLSSTTDLVTKIEREEASPCTRAARLTFWPK